MSRFGDVKASASARWKQARLDHGWLDHVLRAWQRFQDNNGSHYAAAITYFSFLALFPLLLLAAAVLGFVLRSNEELKNQLIDDITRNIPGSLGTQLSSSVKTVVASSTSIGLIGLFGVLLAGLGWVGNLRAAINSVWGVKPKKQNFVIAKVANLFVLAGLGLGVLLSIGLTTVGTAVTAQLIRAADLESVPGITLLVKVTAIGLGVLGDMVIFGWLLIRLPRAQVARGVALRTSLLAAVGFEVLKIVGTYTIAKSTHSPTLGPFASLLAVLIWIQLVVRYMLFCTAWAATVTASSASPAAAIPSLQLTVPSQPPEPAVSRLGVAATLFGAGAATGVGVVSYLRRARVR